LKYQLGIGFNTLKSTLRFDDDAESEVDIQMNTVAVSGGVSINTRWTMHLALGMILNGKLNPDKGPDSDVKPGGFASIGFEYSALTGNRYKPYLDLSVTLGASITETENSVDKSKTKYMSTDLRFGARGSWNYKNRVFPFTAVRVFGGPVMWEINGKDVTGSDIYHYMMSVGSAFKFGSMVLSLEWAGLGERSLKVGLSKGW
jgi:hypothetical protein